MNTKTATLRIRGYDGTLEIERLLDSLIQSKTNKNEYLTLEDLCGLDIEIDIELAKTLQLGDYLWLGGDGYDDEGEFENWDIGENLSSDDTVGDIYNFACHFEYKVVKRLWIDSILYIYIEGISKI